MVIIDKEAINDKGYKNLEDVFPHSTLCKSHRCRAWKEY